MALDKAALDDLQKSGLSAETIEQAGFESHTGAFISKAVKGSNADKPISVDGGYSIPYSDLDGNVTPFKRYKVFGLDGCKYLSPVGAGFDIYTPQGVKALLEQNSDRLVFTEGEKKADAAVQAGIPCLGISGIDCWFSPSQRAAEKLKNPASRLTFSTAIHETISKIIEAYSIKTILVLGDSDCGGTGEKDIKRRKRLEIFADAIRYQVPGAKVAVATCPAIGNKATKIGLDDWLVKKSAAEVQSCMTAALVSASTTTKMLAVDLGTVLSMRFPPRELLCGGWLAKRNLVMVFAARGVGKTLFTMECVTGIITGTSVFGWQCNPTGVLYIDGEMSIAEMQTRFASALMRANSEALAPLRLINPELSPTTPNLASEAGQKDVDRILSETPAIKVIVIDNISTLCANGASENDAESWSAVQSWAVSLRARGYTIIFVHHAGKAGAQRGTSRREDVLDAVLNLKMPDDYDQADGARFEVHFEKHRAFSGEAASAKLIELVDNRWQISPVETSYQKVITLAQNGMKQAEIARELELNKSTVSRILAKALKRGDYHAGI